MTRVLMFLVTIIFLVSYASCTPLRVFEFAEITSVKKINPPNLDLALSTNTEPSIQELAKNAKLYIDVDNENNTFFIVGNDANEIVLTMYENRFDVTASEGLQLFMFRKDDEPWSTTVDVPVEIQFITTVAPAPADSENGQAFTAEPMPFYVFTFQSDLSASAFSKYFMQFTTTREAKPLPEFADTLIAALNLAPPSN